MDGTNSPKQNLRACFLLAHNILLYIHFLLYSVRVCTRLLLTLAHTHTHTLPLSDPSPAAGTQSLYAHGAKSSVIGYLTLMGHAGASARIRDPPAHPPRRVAGEMGTRRNRGWPGRGRQDLSQREKAQQRAETNSFRRFRGRPQPLGLAARVGSK